MADHFTICSSADATDVQTFLIAHGHTFVETIGPFNSDGLIVNTWTPRSERIRLGADDRVIVHTTGP